MSKRKKQLHVDSPRVDSEMIHQIAAPSVRETNRDVKEPFVNDYGVIIGDSRYDSPNSPLNNWSTDVDPAIMAGDQWVHPTNDIGNNTAENADLKEEGIRPQAYPFMHPDKDVSYARD